MSNKLKEPRRKEFPERATSIYNASGPSPDILTDLNEMMERQERLESELLEAKKANLEKDVFLANISHAVRTPMNCIMGYSELALGGDISPMTREYLNKIMENAERLLKSIDGISDISKTV